MSCSCFALISFYVLLWTGLTAKSGLVKYSESEYYDYNMRLSLCSKSYAAEHFNLFFLTLFTSSEHSQRDILSHHLGSMYYQ